MWSRARLHAIALAAAFFGLATLPAQAAGEGTSAIEICGTLRGHSLGTATADGSLRIGSRTFPIASGVAAGNGGVDLTVGRDLCVAASIGTSSGRLLRYLFFPMLSGDRVCGNIIRPKTTDTFAIRADFGELTLVRTAAVAIDNPGQRACYAYQVDRGSGDLMATGNLPVRDNFSDREQVTRCGRVNAYAPATPSASGQITIGTRLLRINAGTTYTGDPAGDRTDRTTVGQPMCLSGTLDAGGAIVAYLTRTMDTGIMATAVAYMPPAGGASGIAILSYRSGFELRIPASIDATIDVARSTYCFSAGVDANGDMSATAVVACPSGGVATEGGASPSPSASPSPADTPEATASSTSVPVAIASPASPRPATENSAPLIAVAIVAIAAVLVLALLAVRGVAR